MRPQRRITLRGEEVPRTPRGVSRRLGVRELGADPLIPYLRPGHPHRRSRRRPYSASPRRRTARSRETTSQRLIRIVVLPPLGKAGVGGAEERSDLVPPGLSGRFPGVEAGPPHLGRQRTPTKDVVRYFRTHARPPSPAQSGIPRAGHEPHRVAATRRLAVSPGPGTRIEPLAQCRDARAAERANRGHRASGRSVDPSTAAQRGDTVER